VELVRAKVESELTLHEMAESANLSPAHFSEMFRKSTGESPHQFVLRHRVERGKEMLRTHRTRGCISAYVRSEPYRIPA